VTSQEGRGIVAPRRVPIAITRADVLQCVAIAVERAKYRRYDKGGTWARGLANARTPYVITDIKPHEWAIVVGSVGEYAVANYLAPSLGECGIDDELRVCGDYGIDFRAYGLTLQVKTRQRPGEHVLVKEGTNKALALVAVEWSRDDVAELLGWEWSHFLNECHREVSRFGSWVNLCVGDEVLRPMSRLRSELALWKELQCR